MLEQIQDFSAMIFSDSWQEKNRCNILDKLSPTLMINLELKFAVPKDIHKVQNQNMGPLYTTNIWESPHMHK